MSAPAISQEEYKLIIQSAKGTIHYADILKELVDVTERTALSFPTECCTCVAGRNSDGDFMLGLSSKGQVFKGSELIAERVASMIKHVDRSGRDMLLMRTRENRLLFRYFHRLTDIPSDCAGYKERSSLMMKNNSEKAKGKKT